MKEPFVFAYGGLQKLSASFHPILLLPSAVISILDVLEGSSIGLQIEDGHQAKCSDICVTYAITKGIMDISTILIPSFFLVLQTPTWIQIISYSTFTLIASLGVLAIDRQASNTAGITPLPYNIKAEAEETDVEEYTTLHQSSNEAGGTDVWAGIRLKGGYHGWLAKLWVFSFGLIATKWFLELETPTRLPNIGQVDPQGQSADTFRSARGLDIVISHYNEDLYGLKAFLDSVGGVPKVRELQPHIIVYTKNQSSNISEIQSVIGTQEVIILPNQGREGGTYLHHITNRWTDLANHTIFVQAEPHEPERIISRLKGYFDPTKTGMMDLGYREARGCCCLGCRDQFGWIDEANLIPELMANAHDISCDENTRVSLTYRGQFIVSAKRIRSVAKKIYEKINAELSGDNRIRLGGEEDSDDNPVLGYTLERSWGILFKCADITGIQDRCPGLTATSMAIGDLRPARPEDCGCLDD
ncbi:hypothetical protein Dda_6954 [Drechslerella dactyloides]|uniref:Uncharacterized protein n=1 Tax=Drechslerella dactyloides TaxID=74499 RepID=A0AAD6IX79_DREDA|nr:hypothetical protein Dda_6954 [Drechslerella dactyloides]